MAVLSILGGDITLYDFDENNQGRLKWTGSPTGKRSYLEVYSATLKEMDNSGNMDQGVPFRAVTPTQYEIRGKTGSPWFIDDETIEHLTGASCFTNGWVSGTDEFILIIGADFNTAFSDADIGRTIVGGTTGDTGTLLDFNSARGLLWIRPDDPSNTGDEFDDPDEAYSIQNDGFTLAFNVSDPGGSPTWTDETANANSPGNGDWAIFPASEATGDYAAFGFSQEFSKLIFDNANGTAGVGGTVAWEYWNGSAWTALTGLTDGTSGFTASVADGQEVTWTAPTDWATTSLNSSAQLYWVRARVTGTYSTNPTYDQGFVGGQGAGNFARHGRHGEASVAGESGWAGLTSKGPIQPNSKAYIYMEDPDKPSGSQQTVRVVSTKGTDSWWPQEGHLDILVKTKEADSIIGPNPDFPTEAVATLLMRHYTNLYSHSIEARLGTGGGETVGVFSTADDTNFSDGYRSFTTDAETGGGWSSSDVGTVIQEQGNTDNKAIITSVTGTGPNYTVQYYPIYTGEDFADNDVIEDEAQTKTMTLDTTPIDVNAATVAITPTFGDTTENINNGNGARPYSIRTNPASTALSVIYPRWQYLVRRLSNTQLLGENGEEYLGNELQVEYNSQAGGNFVEGRKVYDQSTDAEGIIVADHDDGATGDLILKRVRGTFTDTNTISHSPSATQTLGHAASYDDSAGTFTDETSDAQSPGGADVNVLGDQNDVFYIAAAEPFETVTVDIATSGVLGSATGQWQYWNGSSWVSLEGEPNFSDGTSDFTAAPGNSDLVFAPPLDWTARSVNNSAVLYHIRWIVQTANMTTPAVLNQISIADGVTATINGVPRTIVPVAAAPFGTFAGGKAFLAPGHCLTTANLVGADAQAYQLIDDDGNTQIPPNTVTMTVDNLAIGDSVFAARRNGNDIIKDQFQIDSGNNLGDTTVVVDTSIPTDNPTNANSKVYVVSLSNEEHRYRYASYSGVTFTLATASTGTATAGSNLTTITDAGATFVTDGVEPGDMVRNTTDGVSYSRVVTVDSETSLTVTDNGTSWSSQGYSVNTLVENYPVGQNSYVPIIERIADGTSESNSFVFGSSFDIKTVVRRSGLANPILPFEQDTTLSGTLTVTTIRNSDDIIT